MFFSVELERMQRAAEQSGIEIGIERGKLEDAREMLRDGLPVEKVAQYTKLSVDVIQKALGKKRLV